MLRKRQIPDEMGVPLFADHIRALSESTDSKLAYVGKPPCTSRQLLTVPEVGHRCLKRKPRVKGVSRPVEITARDGQVDETKGVRRRSTERPSVNRDFSSVVRQLQGLRCNVGARPEHPSPGLVVSSKRLTSVAHIQFATEPVRAQ